MLRVREKKHVLREENEEERMPDRIFERTEGESTFQRRSS